MEFRSVDEAFNVYKDTEPGTEANMHALAYMLERCPHMKEFVHNMVTEAYPHIKPDWYDAAGNPVYEFNHVMEGLGITEEKRQECIAMIKTMPGALLPLDTDLYPRQ